ncbi:pyridoxamine 5'-phosphate oxidase family protein [Ruminococcus sp. FC2018]|uniref:pyridoxamine 5'-phosphate oxidase family protein n=1 Tax=Ruminococcus sp. FC2018 TaxID=1410617 RepID=UPI00048C7BDD|nr:pyridoxamine 5'-phosphate oxidase family protein [Ruminococcus sp. FC2018]
MFREMRRQKQAISRQECIDLLKRETRGVLAMAGDDGYPYCVPINHYYSQDDGKIYFHGGKTGHRVDAVKACDKVCFTVYDKGSVKDGDWALSVKSVVVFGRIRIVEDFDKAVELCRQLSYKFTDDESYIDEEIRKCAKATVVMELEIEHMTGKLVNEK